MVLAENNCQEFWQLWEAHADYFYNCCLKWMGGNFNDTEEALSQAMLKAVTEWQKHSRRILYPKAWVSKIIYNLCIDKHRKNIKTISIENIEAADDSGFYDSVEIPEAALLRQEMQTYLNHIIASLPDRLRHPFILYSHQEKSYKKIAKQLTISEENARKRVQNARSILKKQVEHYLLGEDETAINSLSLSSENTMGSAVECQPEQIGMGSLASSIPTKTQPEEINYQVTVTCLENLASHWYRLPSCMGWR